MEIPFISELDRIDRAILQALHEDGRRTNAELAEMVHVSPATCHRRTQRLFAAGYVAHVRADISPDAVGLGTLVMVGVVLDRSTPESFDALERAVIGIPEVLDCLLVAGEFDYLLKIRVADMKNFNELHSKTLIALPGVRQIRTFFALKTIKENAPLPF